MDKSAAAKTVAEEVPFDYDTEIPRGLVLRGTVLKRTRRLVGADTQRSVVSYHIFTGEEVVICEEWDPADPDTTGEVVDAPVRVAAYILRNGGAATRLTVTRGAKEAF